MLGKFGLYPTNADQCVFTNRDVDNQLILTSIQSLIAAVKQDAITQLLNELQKEFDITSNELSMYLGLQIERLPDGSIFMHQENYARNILHRFEMEDVVSMRLQFRLIRTIRCTQEWTPRYFKLSISSSHRS